MTTKLLDRIPFGIKKIDFLIGSKVSCFKNTYYKEMSSVSVSKCFSPNSKAARRSGNYQKSMEAAKHFAEKSAAAEKNFKKSFQNDNMIRKYKVTTVSPSGTVSRYNIFARDDEQMNGYFYKAEKKGDKYFSISFFHPLVNQKRDVYNISLQDGWRYSQTLKKITDSDNNIVWKDVRELYQPNVNESDVKDDKLVDVEMENKEKEFPNFLDLPEDEFPEL